MFIDEIATLMMFSADKLLVIQHIISAVAVGEPIFELTSKTKIHVFKMWVLILRLTRASQLWSLEVNNAIMLRGGGVCGTLLMFQDFKNAIKVPAEANDVIKLPIQGVIKWYL